MSTHDSDQLQQDIKTVAWNASNQIQSTDQRAALAAHVPRALGLLLVVPIAGLLLQGIRYLEGWQAASIFPLVVWVGLTVAVPLGWFLYKAGTLRISIDRQRALLAADRQLGSADRITTADEFMQKSTTSGFMEAAVDDAATWAEQGRDTRLSMNVDSQPRKILAWLAVPASALLLGLVFLAGRYTRPVAVLNADSPGMFTPLIDNPESPNSDNDVDLKEPQPEDTDDSLLRNVVFKRNKKNTIEAK
jgi:hypothetical protein